ncbi:hypothetical protein PPYR_07414 [Photinus pyralis]|uniref:Uncharacterized protein n=1 Tax=Photinus pyralis TaxID=7054 RepID=A0A5N4AQC3_PHOPY|nr:probable 4-coumarate--CoA ligase 3 [Photinus pyralis]XP_031339404.1 probable 4-coumarate--CoA ligase 3 [Photinus pyralis]KAB0799534.1 hypothetical protein PPYR_07414 [Photinus pyralis]
MALTKVTHLQKLLPLRARGKGWRSFSDKIIYSKVSNVEVPKLSIDDYVWKDLDKWSDKIAMECAETGRSYSYAEVHKKSKRVANFLTNCKGLSKGDVVATILPNVPEYPMIVLGALQAGLKVSPLSPDLTKDELIYCFGISKPSIIFTLTDLWAKIYHGIKGTNAPIVVMNHREEVMDAPTGAIKLSEVFGNTYPSQKRVHYWNDVIYLPYSSGTTGLMKCIELTNANIMHSVHNYTVPEFNMSAPTDDENQDVFFAILPMSHMSVYAVFVYLALGCKIITVPKFTRKSFTNILRNMRPTICHMVPPLAQLLINDPCITSEHLGSFNAILIGGAPLGTHDLQCLIEKANGKIHVLQAYGMTETAGPSHLQTPHVPSGMKAGSCGINLPGIECKIVNGEGEMLGRNESGTIYIRGPQVFKGYLDNPEATRLALDSEGWLNTGDLGHFDEDDHIFITDRLKEMIKVKGFQVAPAELENILRSHPDVDDAAVVGIPHDRFGEVPKAFIVTRSIAHINLKRIEEFVASKVSKHKHLLGGIVVIDHIPKTPSGKILRRNLRE